MYEEGVSQMFNKLIEKIIKEKLNLTHDEIQVEEIVSCIMSEINNTNCVQFLDENNSVIMVNMEDVLYVYEKSKNIYSFVTLEKEYELLNKNIKIGSILSESFYQLDKKTVVNINLIKWYDSYMGNLYFSCDPNIKDAKKLQVAICSMEIVEKHLGKEKDISLSSKANYIYAPNAIKK
jgi:DNA-binding LytR/AlgR family response regulator